MFLSSSSECGPMLTAQRQHVKWSCASSTCCKNSAGFPMKTNVTLKLDADLLREARVLAAEEGRSISALLTERLEAMVRDRRSTRLNSSPTLISYAVFCLLKSTASFNCPLPSHR